MNSNHIRVHLDSAKSLAEFLLNHDCSEIFVEQAVHDPRPGDGPWEARFVFDRYTAIIDFRGQLLRVFMASMPTLPAGWRLMADQRAGITFSGKTELVTYLRRIGASAETVKKLAKMKAQEIKEFLDTTGDDVVEHTQRLEKKNDSLVMDVTALTLTKSVTCEFRSVGGYGQSMHYVLSADVSEKWEEKSREIHEHIIAPGKFTIYRGHVDEGSRGY